MSRDHVRRPHLYLPASRAVPSHPPGAMSTIVCGPTNCPSIVPATAAWSVPRRHAEGQEGRKAGSHGFGGKIPHGPLCRGPQRAVHQGAAAVELPWLVPSLFPHLLRWPLLATDNQELHLSFLS